ncbi:DUF2371 domain-containing protein [Bacteroides sp. 214]|uniref:DUF6249 domain-containing protein n=1 Tax=Bacteroides sp. 214 TaxID=2302935 RepID=UPI0013D6F537|nr:DUF6249 domain-containing protein [Bacteroides sp. 214]NDW13393.1 DUF2371 domain-containing protein [Bacteroides sp. 214]
MKRILLLLVTAFVVHTAFAQQEVILDDSTGNVKVEKSISEDEAISWTDTPDSATSNSEKSKKKAKREKKVDVSMNFDDNNLTSIFAIIMVFGFPIAIVFISLHYKNKNRKEKYRLIEKALESGQPLPDNFLKSVDKHLSDDALRRKGIGNVFAGAGIFVFLWALTGHFGVACVGLLVMFTGFGQVVIYYTGQNNK